MGLPATPLPVATAYALKSQRDGKVIPLHDGFAIGRAFGDLVLSGERELSSRHCKFLINARGVFVQDLKSTNGVFVNGVKVEKGGSLPVPDGATLEMGGMKFSLEPLEEKTVVASDATVVAEAAPRAALKLVPQPEAKSAPEPKAADPAVHAPARTPAAVAKPAVKLVPVPEAAKRAPKPAAKQASPAASWETNSAFACYLFVALNVIAFYWGAKFRGMDIDNPTLQSLVAVGGSSNSLTTRGEWWRLLTAMFAHSGVMHISSNMLVLVFMGRPLARYMGDIRFAVTYLGAGLLGGIASIAFNPPYVVSVGASGAVFGVVGGLLALQLLKKVDAATVGTFGYMSTVQFTIRSIGLGVKGVDVAAHLGGLTAGFAIAYALFAFEGDEDRRRPQRVAGAAFALVVLLALVIPHHGMPADVEQLIALEHEFGDVVGALNTEGKAGYDAFYAHKMSREALVKMLRDQVDKIEPIKMRLESATVSGEMENKLKLSSVRSAEAVLSYIKENIAYFETGDKAHLKRIRELSRDMRLTEEARQTVKAFNRKYGLPDPPGLDKPVEEEAAKEPDESPAPTLQVKEEPAPGHAPETPSAAPVTTSAPIAAQETAPPKAEPPADDALTALSRKVASEPERDVKPTPAFDPLGTGAPATAPAVVRHEAPTTGSPSALCRASLSRYRYVPSSAMIQCRQANPYSARAVDIYTSIFTGSMGTGALEALMRVDSQEKLDCVAQVCRHYNGSLSTETLEKSCL